MFDTTGKLHVVYDTKQVSERFSKRELVLEVADGKYPQFVQFQLTGDRCVLLDGFKVGDQVRVTFNLRGREWRSPQGETKYFNSLDVWKIESANAQRQRGPRPSNSYDGVSHDAIPLEEPRPGDLGRSSDEDLPF